MDKSSFSVEFLPLNYFIHILTDIESSNPGKSLLFLRICLFSLDTSISLYLLLCTLFLPKCPLLVSRILLHLVLISNIQFTTCKLPRNYYRNYQGNNHLSGFKKIKSYNPFGLCEWPFLVLKINKF